MVEEGTYVCAVLHWPLRLILWPPSGQMETSLPENLCTAIDVLLILLWVMSGGLRVKVKLGNARSTQAEVYHVFSRENSAQEST